MQNSNESEYAFANGVVPLSRFQFWTKMATAVGIVQIIEGSACIFYYVLIGYMYHCHHDVLMGTPMGFIIIVSGVFACVAAKRRTKCMLLSFLSTTIVTALLSCFPLFMGIAGASHPLAQERNLLMPICQLVLGITELLVSLWCIGISSLGLCCPGSAFAHQRLSASVVPPEAMATSNQRNDVMLYPSVSADNPSVMFAEGQAKVAVPNGVGSPTSSEDKTHQSFNDTGYQRLEDTDEPAVLTPSTSETVAPRAMAAAVTAATDKVKDAPRPVPAKTNNENKSKKAQQATDKGKKRDKSQDDSDCEESANLLNSPAPSRSRDQGQGDLATGFEVEDEKLHLLS